MEYISVSAKTLSDAITDACQQLGVTSDRLDYEVIEEGSNGFLGIGSKPAVIKAAVKVQEEVEIPVSKPSVEPAPVKKNNGKASAGKAPVDKSLVESEARTFLNDVFKAMKMEVVIDVEYNEVEETLEVDLEGNEMGVLIGKRGQTLDSLQYLVSLVVNKGTEEYIRVKVDTEDYRQRRKETLENLAKNIAYKVKRTKRPVSLEPMNPYERRIIHSALQNDKYVTTHSEGEEPFRRIVVTLKK